MAAVLATSLETLMGTESSHFAHIFMIALNCYRFSENVVENVVVKFLGKCVTNVSFSS